MKVSIEKIDKPLFKKEIIEITTSGFCFSKDRILFIIKYFDYIERAEVINSDKYLFKEPLVQTIEIFKIKGNEKDLLKILNVNKLFVEFDDILSLSNIKIYKEHIERIYIVSNGWMYREDFDKMDCNSRYRLRKEEKE